MEKKKIERERVAIKQGMANATKHKFFLFSAYFVFVRSLERE